MKYGSVCSGIEAASVAWEPLGWEPVFFSEIEPFPRAVLAHHYPNVPCHGDFTTIKKDSYAAIDVLVGGTPCFVGDTLILTDAGLRTIKDVKVGDTVLTHLGNWRKVLAIGSKDASTVLVKGQGNHGTRSTSEHPYWCMDKVSVWHNDIRCGKMEFIGVPKWVEARKMEGLFWAIPAQAQPLNPSYPKQVGNETSIPYFNECLMFLAGAYLGNGWTRINQRRGCAIFGMGKKEHPVLEDAIRGCGLSFCKVEDRTTFKYQVASRSLARWLKDNFGSGAKDKSIPAWCLYGQSEEMRKALLAGYRYTDGCDSKDNKKVNNGQKFTTISRALAQSVQLLGASLGYSTSVTRVEVTPTKLLEGRTVNQQTQYSTVLYQNSRTAGFMHGMLWQKCKSVTPTDEIETVYNLEVEGDNSYVADGIAVHNCQDFSLAGLRGGLDGSRGNLSLEFGKLLGRLRPAWFCWENVPGVFSSNAGADFAGILGMFTGRSIEVPTDGWRNSGVVQGIDCAYSVAWRVLDAQYAGVPQRRRRVFVVGCLGADWRRASAVLFERHSLSGDSPPSRKKGKGVATCFDTSTGSDNIAEVANTLNTRMKDGPRKNQGGMAIVGFAQYSPDHHPLHEAEGGDLGGGSEALIVMSSGQGGADSFGDFCTTLTCDHEAPIIFESVQCPGAWPLDTAPTLDAHFGEKQGLDNQHIDGGAGLFVPIDESVIVVRTANTKSRGCGITKDVSYTLDCAKGQAVEVPPDPLHTQPIAFTQNTRDEVRDLKDVAGCLGADEGMKQRTYLAYSVDEECNANEELHGPLLRGGEGGTRQTIVQVPQFNSSSTPNVDDELNCNDELMGALKANRHCAFVQIPEKDIANTLKARNDGGPNGQGQGYHEIALALESEPTPINTQIALRGADTSNSSREGIGVGNPGDPSFTLLKNHHHAIGHGSHVRRLTPKEASRLQGFPDDFAKIPWKGKPADQCPDGPQYKAYGNSFAVPVIRWIGERIQMVHEIIMRGE